MQKYPKLFLKSGRERSLQRYHLWIFSGAIKKTEGNPADGDWVEIFDNKGIFLAAGHFNRGSIVVRVLTFQQTLPDQQFWNSKIQRAVDLRRNLGFFDADGLNTFRLVHGEGDGLPGLIIDYYNGVAVVQCHSMGMFRDKDKIAEALLNALPGKITAIYDKSHHALNLKEFADYEGSFLYGSSGPVEVLEYGNRFEIDFVEGQKTGFFIDQRENRRLLGDYSAGKKVLNAFCYTGGFSVFAAARGAKEVVSVDVSEKAILQTEKNLMMNHLPSTRLENIAEDVFKYLDGMDDSFDTIILDPPAFAKHQNALANALKGYRRLNEKAFAKIKKGGILFTFSCSQVVGKDDFRKAIFSAAAASGRPVRILHQLSQPADHPINIYHPETEYLKGLVLAVE